MNTGMDTKAGFIDAIVSAADSDDPKATVASRLEQILADWDGHAPWEAEPVAGGFETLHASPALTIMHLIWPPLLMTKPHTHNMWAVIGLFLGRENNVLWKREGHSIAARTAVSLASGEVCAFDENVIHSVHNPIDGFTGAIHVYGGDFLAAENSEWDPLTLTEGPRDMMQQQATFASND